MQMCYTGTSTRKTLIRVPDLRMQTVSTRCDACSVGGSYRGCGFGHRHWNHLHRHILCGTADCVPGEWQEYFYGSSDAYSLLHDHFPGVRHAED